MFFLGAACSLTSLACADGNTGLIYGKVLLERAHIPICPIAVTAISGRQAPQQTFTRDDGSYHFLTVSPGPVTLVIGDNLRVHNLTVSANLSTSVEPTYLPIVSEPRSVISPGGAERALRLCSRNSYHQYFFSELDKSMER